MGYEKPIAVFLMCIIVMLPVTMAAPRISAVRARGVDEIQDLIKADDTLHVEADITGAENFTLAPEQVIFYKTKEPFDSCDTAMCIYERELTDQKAEKTRYIVELYDANGTKVDQEDSYYYVDNEPAKVTSFSVEPALVSSGTALVKFEAADTACKGCKDKCAGIASISIFMGETSLGEPELNDTASCSISGELEISTSDLGDGQHEICAMATDRFGLGGASYKNCVTVLVDSQAPSIYTETFMGLDQDGLNITYLPERGIYLDFSIDVSDAGGSSLGAVFGDFIEFGLSTMQAVCAQAKGNISICKWENVLVKQGGSIAITASDGAGNNATESVSFTAEVDNIGPVATSIITNHQGDDGIYYFLSSGNNVTAAFTESQSGMSKAQAWLDLSQVTGASSDTYVKADSCVDGWTCYWNNIEGGANDGKEVTVTVVGASDDLGTGMNGTFESTFMINLGPPVVKDVQVNLSQAFAEIAGRGAGFANGDTLDIHIIVQDKSTSSVTANADFSGLFNVTANQTGDCVQTSEEDGLYECSWLGVGPLSTGYKQNAKMKFWFADSLGLTSDEPYEKAITIYETSEEGDYWDMTIGSSSPSAIDKYLIGVAQLSMYFVYNLTPKADNVELYSVEISDCAGPEAEGNNTNASTAVDPMQYIASFDLIHATREKGYIEFVIGTTAPSQDILYVECELKINSLVDQKTIVTGEMQNATFALRFYNMPYGEVSDNIRDEIERVAKGDLVNNEWITSVKNLFQTIQRICGMIRTISEIVTFINWVFLGVSPLENTGFLAPVVKALQGMTTGTSLVRDGVWVSIGWVCNFASCNLPWQQWYNQWSDTILASIGAGRLNQGGRGNRNLNLGLTLFPENPQDSIILSTVTLCIPGIVYNLDKARQIDCNYIYCLRNNVANGVPVYMCKEQRAFLWCEFVYGQIFQLIPFYSLFRNFGDFIKAILSDPLALIFGVTGVVNYFACHTLVKAEPTAICLWTSNILSLSKIISDIGDMTSKSSSWKTQKDMCKDALKDIDEFLEETDDSNDEEEF